MEFRALSADELEVWLDHVTSVFSGGRRYFSNHWHNDPWRDAEGIRVAIDDGQIVSTVRVFIREMFLHGEPIRVGGIGEVSTRPEYRRQGIATRLLQDSVAFMESRDIVVSSLHGSQRIYAIEGWEKVPRYYAKQQVAAQEQSGGGWEVRPANFDDETEVGEIAGVYDGYARKFNGTFVRDELEYWRAWVRTESPNAWVATRGGKIDGYVSVNPREDELSVKEFIASEDVFTEDRGKRLFEEMLSHIVADMGAESLEVVYPAPIADGFNAPVIEEHGSAMYRIIQPAVLAEKMDSAAFNSIPNLLHNQVETLAQGLRSHHIFWYTDGY